MMDETIPVQVAVRCRPLIPLELRQGSQNKVRFNKENEQVLLPDLDKAFTFDYAFSPSSTQDEVYSRCCLTLIEQLFHGYNATVLAYGQTGSGKTFTMGTSYSNNDSTSLGIIPRAVRDIFQGIEERKDTTVLITVSFLEVYNEDVFDLFGKTKEAVQIREDIQGQVKVSGLTEIPVNSEEDVLSQLSKGSSQRKTGSTNMNDQSSRSHAIFTLSMVMTKACGDGFETVSAKFQLVDLAGSEKAKKTGAQGDRFKEGVNINKGLFALGNVISALCDKSSHVPYRDSKLTRLLQDSLGGNSHTVMVACISPADSNLEETVNTLKYADRARKIENKPVINMDPTQLELENLRSQYESLTSQWENHLRECPLKNKKVEPESAEKPKKESEPAEKPKQEPDPKSAVKPKLDLGAKPKTNSQATKVHRNAKTGPAQAPGKAKPENAAVQPPKTLPSDETSSESDCILEVKLIEKDDEIRSLAETNAELLRFWAATSAQNNAYLKNNNQLEETLKDLKNRFQDISEGIRGMGHIAEETSIHPSKELLEKIDNFSQVIVLVNKTAFESPNHQDKVIEFADCNTALEELEADLKQKQQELEKQEANNSDLEPLKKIADNQQKQIEHLEKEKTTLENYMKNNPAAKISEERRKKIAALEKQVSLLRKQLEVNKKALKAKEDAEKKVNLLNQEINALKKSRVVMRKQQERANKLVREQRLKTAQEAAQANKKVNSLRFSNQRLETRSKVLEQKLRQIETAKRNLEDTLSKRSIRAAGKSRQKSPELIHDFLRDEISSTISHQDVKEHVEELMEARAALQEEKLGLQQQLKDLGSEPAQKKSLSGDEASGLFVVDVKKSEIEKNIEHLDHLISCRSEQIGSFHKKMFKDDTGKFDIRFFADPQDLKEGLNYLLEQVVYYQRALSKSNCQLLAARDDSEFAENNYKQLRSTVESMKVQHQVQLTEEKQKYEQVLNQLERDSQLKIIQNLQDTSCITLASAENNPELLNQCTQQAKEIKGLAYVYEQLNKKSEECETLRQMNLELQKRDRKSLFMDCSGASATVTKKKAVKLQIKQEDPILEDDEEFFLSDDNNKDPDWQKTPIFKRSSTKPGAEKYKLEFSTSEDEETKKEAEKKGKKTKALRRTTSAKGCQCSANVPCKTNHCQCHKRNEDCTALCGCPPEKCINQPKPSNTTNAVSGSKNSELNTTFLAESDEMPLHRIENLTAKKSSTTVEASAMESSGKSKSSTNFPLKRKLHQPGKSVFFPNPNKLP